MREDQRLACPHCGRQLMFEDNVCPYCGQSIGGRKRYVTVGQKARQQRAIQHRAHHRVDTKETWIPQDSNGVWQGRETKRDPEKKNSRGKKIVAIAVAAVLLFQLIPVAFNILITIGESFVDALTPEPSHVYQDQYPYVPPLPSPEDEDYYYVTDEELAELEPDAIWMEDALWEKAYPDLTEEEEETMDEVARRLRCQDSEARIRDDMTEDRYDEAMVQEALNRMDVDWNAQALRCMYHYLRYSSFYPEEMRMQLEYEQFTADQIQYAMENCQVDWHREMELLTADFVQLKICSEQRLREENTTVWKFPEEDFEELLAQMDADWDQQALMAGAQYMDTNDYTQQELRDRLLEDRFTLEQCKYAESYLFAE